MLAQKACDISSRECGFHGEQLPEEKNSYFSLYAKIKKFI